MRRRILASAAGLVLVALALPACSSSSTGLSTGSTDAATVDGTSIPNRQFTDDLAAYAANTAYAQEYASIQQSSEGVTASDGTVTNTFARNILRNEILYTLVGQEVKARSLDVSAQDAAAVRAQTLGRFSQKGDEAIFNAFPKDFQDRVLAQTANVMALQQDFLGPAPTDAQLQAAYDADPRKFGKVCVSHILVATKAEADAALQQIKSGTDFGTLAESISTDPSAQNNGGSLANPDGSCTEASQYVPEFVDGALAATVGVPSEPVQTQFGWHIIRVDKWEPVPFADAKPAVTQSLQRSADSALNDWLTAALAKPIWVNPRYGTWDGKAGVIQPPTVGPVTPTTNSTAATTTQG